MKNKRVTCVMTVYKKYTYLYRAIDSVLSQKYDDIELIICDDCSGDFPQQEIIEYIEKNKRNNLKSVLVYSNEMNLGTVKNFNTALRKASGYYFIGLSGDDIFWSDTVFQQVVQKFDETGAVYATCRAVMKTTDERNGLCFQLEKSLQDIKRMNAIQLYNRISKDNIILGACTYFTLDAIKKFGYFDEQYIYIEDISKFLAICRSGEKIEFFDIPSIWHTMDGISNTRQVPKRYLQDNLNICKNEILSYKEQLSWMSYRYNLCRKENLESRIKSGGEDIPTLKKLWIAIRYPDAALYNVWVAIRRKKAKRIRMD